VTRDAASATATTNPALIGLEPEALWRHFEALTKVARPSGHEEHVIEHVRAWAADNGFDYRQDGAQNLVVGVPASAGRDSAPVIVLQGHLDMVCERNPESPNDPAEGRIKLVRDGDWLTADGTTLGADDGVGIAAMMAIAEASLPHGPLELLMTVNEEVGGPNEGASGLDPALVSGRTLLNLDSEEDGKLTVGSASSTDTSIRIEKPREACEPGSVTLVVCASGGLGGHSGVDIARGHANAIKVLARALRETLAVVPFRLACLTGGKSLNAIPRDAIATCCLPAKDQAAFRAVVKTAAATIRDAYAKTDPDVAIIVSSTTNAADAWTASATETMLDLLAVLPSGPLAMSTDFPGLVETSTSLDAAVTDGTALTLQHLSRSSNPSAPPDVIEQLEAAARLTGGVLTVGQADPGWPPNLDSSVLAASRRVYARSFRETPAVTAVHAWLETSVIGARIPDLDMVSFGPQIEAPHSPEERVSVPTVQKFWRLLTDVVDELSH
jgi:dipeptidase D